MYLDLKCSTAKEISGHTAVYVVGLVPRYLRALFATHNHKGGRVLRTIRYSMKSASQQMLDSSMLANTNSRKLKLFGFQNDEDGCGEGSLDSETAGSLNDTAAIRPTYRAYLLIRVACCAKDEVDVWVN